MCSDCSVTRDENKPVSVEQNKMHDREREKEEDDHLDTATQNFPPEPLMLAPWVSSLTAPPVQPKAQGKGIDGHRRPGSVPAPCVRAGGS